MNNHIFALHRFQHRLPIQYVSDYKPTEPRCFDPIKCHDFMIRPHQRCTNSLPYAACSAGKQYGFSHAKFLLIFMNIAQNHAIDARLSQGSAS